MIPGAARWNKSETAVRGPYAPVAYDVECGFCRQLVSLPTEALGRGFPCPVCGGMLALVSPVPIVPAEPAPIDFPALSRDRWHPPGMKPDQRERLLAPSWRVISHGLLVARLLVLCTLPLLVFFVLVDLFLRPLVRPDPLAGGLLHLLPPLFLLALPIAVHAGGQIICARVAPFPGSHAARRSLELQGGAAFVLFGFSFIGPSALIAFAVLLLAGFALWLRFLDRLARRIDEDDHALLATVRTCRQRYWVEVAILFGLFVGAGFAFYARNWTVLWLCRATAGAIVLVLVADYAALLRTVARAIARRAPMASSSEPAAPVVPAAGLTPSA